MNLHLDGKSIKRINLGLFAISLVPLLLFVFVVSQRVHLPFDWEWGEGAGINQIYQHLSGGKLYAAPSLEFTPLVYTPLYYWISSLFSRLGVPILLAARILSLASSFGSAGVLAWLIYRASRNPIASWLSGALYLACFALSEGYYDLVRVDSLYILCLLVSFLVLMESRRYPGKVIAGLLIAVGFYIKQSALIVFIPLLIYLAIKKWKAYWPFHLATVLGVIAPLPIFNFLSEGWFKYYIFDLPKEHGYSIISSVNFWIGDLVGPLGIAIGFGLAYCVIAWERRPGRRTRHSSAGIEEQDKNKIRRDNLSLFVLFVIGAIGTAWITRSSNGGGANNAMSAYAAIALMFGLGFDAVMTKINEIANADRNYYILLSGLVALQFIGLIYNPFHFLPTKSELDANQAVVEYLDEIEGNIFIPYRSHLAIQAGKEPSIHVVNLFELTGYFKGDVLPEGRDLVQQIRQKICTQEYTVIALDQPIPWFDEQLDMAYQLDRSFSYTADAKRSQLLYWQGGFDAFYVPLPGHNLDDCLEGISLNEND